MMALRGALYGTMLITDHYHRMNKVYFLLVLMSILTVIFGWSGCLNIIKYNSRMPDRNVFTEGLNVISLYPFGEKIHSDDVYKKLFVDCANGSLTHDVLSYRQSFVDVQKKCFTRKGFDSFMNELNGQSGVFKSIKSGNIWNVESVSDVKKLKEGFYKDAVYYQTWSAKVHVQKVNMKTDINYINDVLETTYTLKAMIVRQNNVDFADGIAIARLVLE